MKLADQVHENVVIAIATLRGAKLRSALTILGVVIGISTVMAMATLVNGVQTQIVSTIETAGPTTFYVMKVFSQTPLNPDALPAWVRIRPDLQWREAQRIAQLPEISYASLWAIKIGRIEYKGQRTQPNRIYGADERFTEIIGGELVMAVSPPPDHQTVVQETFVKLDAFVREHRLGRAFLAPLDVVIRRAPRRTRQADVMFIRAWIPHGNLLAVENVPLISPTGVSWVFCLPYCGGNPGDSYGHR